MGPGRCVNHPREDAPSVMRRSGEQFQYTCEQTQTPDFGSDSFIKGRTEQEELVLSVSKKEVGINVHERRRECRWLGWCIAENTDGYERVAHQTSDKARPLSTRSPSAKKLPASKVPRGRTATAILEQLLTFILESERVVCGHSDDQHRDVHFLGCAVARRLEPRDRPLASLFPRPPSRAAACQSAFIFSPPFGKSGGHGALSLRLTRESTREKSGRNGCPECVRHRPELVVLDDALTRRILCKFCGNCRNSRR